MVCIHHAKLLCILQGGRGDELALGATNSPLLGGLWRLHHEQQLLVRRHKEAAPSVCTTTCTPELIVYIRRLTTLSHNTGFGGPTL